MGNVAQAHAKLANATTIGAPADAPAFRREQDGARWVEDEEAPASTTEGDRSGLASASVTHVGALGRVLPWFLVLLALVLLLVFPPFAVLAAGGAALYAQDRDLRALRNAAVVTLFFAVAFSVLFLVFGTGDGLEGGLVD